MANPVESKVWCIQDGATRRLLSIGSDGSLNIASGGAASTSAPVSTVVNIQDGTSSTLLVVNANGSVSS